MGREPQSLVEREKELEALKRILQRAASGSGNALVIEGPAGIGKSSLLRQAVSQAERASIPAFTARGGNLESEYPYGVVRQLFGREVQPGDAILTGAAAAAAPALGFETGPGPADVEESSISHGLYWLISNIADPGPAVLIVDDLQWADVPSLRFLLFLVRRLDDLPVAVIAGSRVSEQPLLTELYNEPAVTIVRPLLLSREGSTELVRARTDDAATQQFGDACFRATGGNPHLLRELLVSLEADGLPPDDNTALRVPSMSPASVSRSVLIRLAPLGPDAAHLAHAIAVLGDSVELRHAAALADLEIDRAAIVADDLVRISLLAPGRPLDVVHPLIGEILRADIGDAERSRLHRRSARLLHEDGANPERVAAHLDLAEPAGERWVVDVLREASVRGRKEGAPDAARRWLMRALAEGVPTERSALLVDLGEVLTISGEAAEAVAILREAVETAPHGGLRSAAALALARAYIFVDDVATARDVLDAAVRNTDVDDEMLLRLRGELAWCLAATAEESETLTRDDFDAFSRLTNTAPHEIEALSNVVLWHMVHGRRKEAIELAMRASGDPGALVQALADHQIQSFLNMLTLMDEHERARQILQEWFERSQRRGSLQGFASASAAQAILEWHAGDLDSCYAAAQTATECAGWTDANPKLTAFCALVLVERGELDEALTVAHDAVERSDDHPDIPLYARARAHRSAGRLDEAIADLGRVASLEADYPVRLLFPPWRLEMAECALARGDRPTAQRWLADEVERIRPFGTPSVIGATERVRALMSTGQQRVIGLRTAAEILATSVSRLEYARTLVALGATLRATGKRDDAQKTLREGADLAHQCGAIALAKQALGELEATGARPRRIRVTGVDALTGAERRVATLAATERSNASIAQALFLTRSTVEKHLTSAYRKLGITSRADLATLLEGDDGARALPDS